MNAWYIEDGERYRQELEALDKAGIKYTEDGEAKSQGYLRLCLLIPQGNSITINGLDQDLELTAVFPALYPFFRPEVSAFDLSLPRHQNPIQKNLCLLQRSTSSWRPEDTLADLLTAQLNDVLIKGRITSYDELSKDAEEQAEPMSEYYPVAHSILFDTAPYDHDCLMDEFQYAGKFTYGIPTSEKKDFIRLAVLKSFDIVGKELSSLPDAIANLFNDHTGRGVVCRVNEAPPFDPRDFIPWLKKNGGSQALNDVRSLNLGSRKIEYLVAINFPEEITPGKLGAGWIFYIQYKMNNQSYAIYGKALRANKSAISQRAPKLAPLGDKKILIVGLGALGGPAAIEFARNGVEEVRIIDHDIVDPATTIRWPLGMGDSGLFKTDSIRKFIETNYPYTKVVATNWKIGSLPADGNKISEVDKLDNLFKGASLIFDASAEIGVMNYLSLEAQKRGIPYVAIEATQGALGGQIMRVDPSKTEGCWMCLQYAQDTGDIAIPPKDDSGRIQAAGCGDLSFTGTSFDLQNIHTAGVRLAISTLCGDDADGYPCFDWDVSVLSLVDENGKAISPQWSDYKLNVHPKCPYCANTK